MHAAGALRARIYLVLRGVQVDKRGTLPELNWCYPIRRRVGGNAGVYLGMS